MADSAQLLLMRPGSRLAWNPITEEVFIWEKGEMVLLGGSSSHPWPPEKR